MAAVGTLDAVRTAMPPGADEVALDGGALLPAFVDAHQHAYLVAVDPFTDVLHRAAADIPGLLRLVSSLLAAAPRSDGWLRFHGYVPLELAELRSPSSIELDTICPDRPLHLLTRTYHESVVNSAGLAALGIGRSTPDPRGG